MRKRVFDKEDVLSAAMAEVRERGLESLSARRVAQRLGSSTAPVYSNFRSMEELSASVRDRAVGVLLEEVRRPRSHSPFLDMGIGVLHFALDHPNLYGALFLAQGDCAQGGWEPLDRLLQVMDSLPDVADLDPLDRLIVLKKMGAFTHGLCMQIRCGRLTAEDLPWAIVLMKEVGQVVVEAARGPDRRTPEDHRLLAAMAERCGLRPAGGRTGEPGKGNHD